MNHRLQKGLLGSSLFLTSIILLSPLVFGQYEHCGVDYACFYRERAKEIEQQRLQQQEEIEEYRNQQFELQQQQLEQIQLQNELLQEELSELNERQQGLEERQQQQYNELQQRLENQPAPPANSD